MGALALDDDEERLPPLRGEESRDVGEEALRTGASPLDHCAAGGDGRLFDARNTFLGDDAEVDDDPLLRPEDDLGGPLGFFFKTDFRPTTNASFPPSE